MEVQPIVINFKSQKEVVEMSYQVILATLNDMFLAAKGDLKKMKALNQLSKELRYATENAIDKLLRGPMPYREPTLPESAIH